MTLVFTLLTIAVLGLVVAVALGWIGGGLDAPTSSLPPTGLPDGDLAPQDLERVRFAPALRGYRMDQVDEALDRVAGELARRDAEIERLQETLLDLRTGGMAQDVYRADVYRADVYRADAYRADVYRADVYPGDTPDDEHQDGCGDGVQGDGVNGHDVHGRGVHGDGVNGRDVHGHGVHGDVHGGRPGAGPVPGRQA